MSDHKEDQSEDMPIKEKKEVPQGTLILQEKPFVYTLCSRYRTECCDFCFKNWKRYGYSKTNTTSWPTLKNSCFKTKKNDRSLVADGQKDLLKCSACKYVHYCGRACQREGWGLHKLECKNFKRTYPRALPDAARMLFRLAKVLEKGGGSKKSYYSENGYRTYKDLLSHYPNLKNDQGRMEHLSSLYGVLYEFSGNDFLPNSAELMGMYGRMCINSFSICNQEMQSVGTGMFLAASIIDHSCQPNAVATFEGTTLHIRTLEKLSYLDWSKITISYIDILASTKERQNQLEKTYYFLCDCVKCQEPELIEELFGAECPMCSKCIYLDGSKNSINCQHCGKELNEKFREEFKEAVEFTESNIETMKTTTYLDVCRLCLKKHKNLLNKHHLRHVKILDLAFESCIDLQYFDEALTYGLELVDNFLKYYPKIHPLTGLLHLKLCKLLLYKDRLTEGIGHLKKASEILRITHGITSSLYKVEVMPLVQECRLMMNGCIH